MDLLDEFKVTATFFIVADVAEHYPGLIESISERGHEIACHGADHTCVLDTKTKKLLLSFEEFEATTLKAKKLLERVSGQEIIGYRAPNGAVTGWMLDSLEKIGFKYDSSVSVNSLYNKSDSSLRAVSSFPYYPALAQEKFPSVGRRRPFYWTIKGEIVEERLRYVFNKLENVNKVPLRNQVRSYCDTLG